MVDFIGCSFVKCCWLLGGHRLIYTCVISIVATSSFLFFICCNFSPTTSYLYEYIISSLKVYNISFLFDTNDTFEIPNQI